MPNSSLRYVLVYVMETPKGFFLVDVGWNTDDAYDALCDGLRQAGGTIADVAGVMVTHIHPDHYGLAGRVREASGAWISLHPADARLVHERYDDPTALIDQMGTMLARQGTPADEIEALKNASMQVRGYVDAAVPDVLLEDGAKPEIPGWDITAIWTPGHSPGHLCFWEDTRKLLLSGDHVLPRITPNISFHPQAGDNPLGDFLDSLRKLETYQPDEVLPAHEFRFKNLHARLDELHAHHAQRFAEVIDAIRTGHTTTYAIAQKMRWSRSWDRIEGFMRRAAVSEAAAHLKMLEQRGIVHERVGEPSTWHVYEDE